MRIADMIHALGYTDSPNFIHGDGLARAGDYGHVFRRAQDRMRLRGVYALQQPASKQAPRKALVAVVYVCEADDEKQAHVFRRLAWNQNAAPFVIIRTPACIRLFSGFNYPQADSGNAGKQPSILDRQIEFTEISTALDAFKSQSIDDGTIWRECGQFVTPKGRVDWNLLDALEKLDASLIASGLERGTSHALIGKYVYLQYLRQRDILSNRRFEQWAIDPDHIFGRNATLTAFRSVLDRLDGWLNGSVFPLVWTRDNAPKQEHLRKVAGVFCGDTLDGQLHLPFYAYDFSIIPVETLSAIYEQFLHAHEPKEEQSRGKKLGAYYTPVALVNFMLDELNDRRPLQEGMSCFDASCGSGAFLVQCYRHLIENLILKDGRAIRRPRELRDLLENHIFGLDRDGDACRVTELSLLLTLLDYVDPPDLSPVHNFKLPTLHDRNIFEADFFNPHSTWVQAGQDRRYDWVVGNPPWVELKPPKEAEKAKDKDPYARQWMKDNAEKTPISGNQLAEAFLWKVAEYLKPDGVAAMLVPAMTLFKSESKAFRQAFFSKIDVRCVVNFSNMAYVLFHGRSQVPAAAFFYGKRQTGPQDVRDQRSILTYAPLVANQQANVPDKQRSQKETWSITVNGSEVREVTAAEASSGDPLVWKAAMWGSRLDQRLLGSVSQRFGRFGEVCNRLKMEMHQGIELPRLVRPGEDEESRPKVGSLIFTELLVDKYAVDTKSLLRHARIYSFPDDSLLKITKEDAYLREGRADLPMRVSEPPHIIVDSGRRFAVFSNDFIAVPGWLVGIKGQPPQADLLKAMSLFLSSDFAIYHQFLCSPKWGIHASVAGLDTLKAMPFPLDQIERSGLTRWSKLHAALVRAASTTKRAPAERGPSLFAAEEPTGDVAHLERELNDMVNEALGLREADKWLVSDLVHVRSRFIKGKIDPVGIAAPSPEGIRQYCEALKCELDSFVEVVTDDRYMVEVVHERESAMIVIRRGPARPPKDSVRILSSTAEEARPIIEIRQKLLKKHTQWLYFERALRCYVNGTVYLFKPMQRLHWLRSQALIDAGEIIADTAGGGEA